MPGKNQNSIPNSNNLFAIYQSQVASAAVLVDVITKTGVDKNLVKSVESAAKAMDTALDVIYKSLEKMSSYDVGKSNEAAKAILSTTKAINSLTTVVTNVNKINPAAVRMARKSIKRLMTLMFGKPGKNPAGLIPLLKKAGDGRSTKSITNGIKNLKQVSTATKELAGTAVILGLTLPFVAVAILSGKLLYVVVKGLLKTFSLASRKEKQIMTASKVFKAMSVSLMLFVASIVLVGITMVLAAPLVAIALVAILGLVGMMILVGALSKRIDVGVGELMKIAKAVLVLSLTALLLALTGQFIVANWESFLIIGAYMIVLVGTFLLLAFTSKWIEAGAKQMLYIAAAIAILATTALLMAFVGQFITANWENMLIIGAYLVILVGAFMLLAYSTKWIKEGAKQMLWIALTVAILVGVAFLMIIVGNLLKVNWEPVLTVTLLLTILVGAVCLVAHFSKKIESGWKAMLIVALFSIVMTAVVFALAKIANSADPLELLEVVGIMALIIVAIGGVAVAAGMLQAQIEQGMIAMLLIAGMSLVMSIVMKNIAEAASIAPPLEILEVSGIMALIVVALGAVSIAAGALLAGPQAILFGLGLVAMGSLSLIGLAMAEVVKHTAIAATAVKAAGFKEPKEVADIISLPIKAFTMEDKDGKSLFGYIADLPNPIAMVRYVGKVESLAQITNSIGLMADILQHIASLNMPDPDKGYDDKGKPKGYKQMVADDFMAAAQNAAVILGMTSAMFGEENVDFQLGDGAKFTVVPCNMAALDKISWATKIKIKRLTKIVGYISDMADTLQHIASLNIPDPSKGFTEDGRPKGYLTMTSTDFMMAAQNAGSILVFFTSLFAEDPTEVAFGESKVTVNPLNMQALDNISRSTRRKVERLGEIVAAVGGMASNLQNISSMMIPDPAAGFTEDGKPKGFTIMTGDNFRDAAINAGSILAFFANIFAEEPTTMDFAGTQVTVTPINMQTLDNISRSTRRKVVRLGEIVAVVGGMAETLKNMSSLTVPDAMGPDDFNENGTPKKWRMMTAQDIADAALTAGSMLEFFCALFGEESVTLSLGSLGGVVVNPISEDALDNISRSTKKKMESLGAIIACVGGMGETLKNLASLIVPDCQTNEDFNENGTPKKWRKMTQQDFNNAMKMAEKMLTSIVNILGDERMQDKLSDMSKRSMEKLGIAMQAVVGLGNVMDLIKALAGGRMASKWKRDNDPNSPTYGQEVAVEYINLVDYINKNERKIRDTIYELIMCPIRAIAWITESDSAMEKVEQANKGGMYVVSTLNMIKQPITDIIDLYNDKLSGVDTSAIRPAFEGVMVGILGPLAELDPDRMETTKKGSLVVFERVAASLTKLNITDNVAKNFQNNVKETVGLLKTVDSVNIDKLKVADSLMKHIADLSRTINGNFKELAHAINEDLLEALEKLTGALDAVNEKDFNVSVAGDVINTPTGSAGVKDKQEPPKNNIQITKADIEKVTKEIKALTTKIGSVIDSGSSKVNVAMK